MAQKADSRSIELLSPAQEGIFRLGRHLAVLHPKVSIHSLGVGQISLQTGLDIVTSNAECDF